VSPPPTVDPHDALADALLGETLHRPIERALRIAGIYAALFLEEPWLFRWGGIACFVSHHLHRALQTPDPDWDDRLLGVGLHAVLADTNLLIYRNVVPAWLQYRDGTPIRGPMSEAFNTLRRADDGLLGGPAQAERDCRDALVALCRVEQERIVQPQLRRLPRLVQRQLAPLYQFRLGYDSAAPVLRFDGRNPADFEQRWAWTRDRVLPAWQAYVAQHAELHRADCDRLRRRAEVRLDELPPRA
jgi:hypothetical protein